ncbi:hypothetical protein CYMTET_19568 [Cymbomonas tetramitiformis]|uniref:allantoinase n=1 Tax=Cymbomonas tetramitiformis TaxID=36881 RepID=A0AAE0L523_9CHLO|nr:hypothetical protein CYMTET_19568 [Cymbomonas tetramitiformis]
MSQPLVASSQLHIRMALLVICAAYVFYRLNKAGGQERLPECGLLGATKFVVYSKNVVTPKGVQAAAVSIMNGKITQVKPAKKAPRSKRRMMVLDYGDKAILPGGIDLHAHLNEPGRADWEGFVTGTQAAAAGGITTVVDMPLNSFPTTTTLEAFDMKLEAADGKLYVDTAFWAGLVPENAGNHSVLEALLAKGAVGFKAFMSPSGINDFPNSNKTVLRQGLEYLVKNDVPLMVHAEDPPLDAPAPEGDPRSYLAYMSSRPREWEKRAIKQLIELAEELQPAPRIHIAHLSDADNLPILAEAKARGLQITVETCPHYLMFAAEEIPDGSTLFKCAPPIREAENRERLWAGLEEGVIDVVSSDHSPSTPELKLLEEGDFQKAWGGISGLQMGLSATWSEGVKRNATLEKLAQWWSTLPAQIAQLPEKGLIKKGYDADLVVLDLEEPVDTSEEAYRHKHKVSPYLGLEMYGQVHATFVRGYQMLVVPAENW